MTKPDQLGPRYITVPGGDDSCDPWDPWWVTDTDTDTIVADVMDEPTADRIARLLNEEEGRT